MYTAILMISNRSTGIHYENTPGATLQVYLHMYMVYMNTGPAQRAGRVPKEPIVDAPHVEYVLALRQGPHKLLCSEILVSLIYHVISTRQGANCSCASRDR